MESLLPYLSSGAELGAALRDQGMGRVEAANPEWIGIARNVLVKAARSVEFLTVEYLWPELEGYGVSDRRALGPVMRWGSRNGFIEPTNQHELADRPECHRRPLRVWRSLVKEEIK